MKKTNRILVILIILILFVFNISKANQEIKYKTIDLNIKDIDKKYDIYLLLPEEYIEFLIALSGENIKYEGTKTLKENNILGLNIVKENVQDNLYELNEKKYIKIYLNSIEQNHYQFQVRDEYYLNNIKFLISVENKDYMVMHMDNFKYNNNGICKIIYNYKENTLKNEVKNKGKIAFWQILLVAVIIFVTMYFINKIKSKEN